MRVLALRAGKRFRGISGGEIGRMVAFLTEASATS
jgi:hypothetical protein